MKPGELYWSLVDPIWDRVSIYDGPEVFLDQVNKVSEVQKYLFAAHWCQSEVRNGGLHQFFSNDTGVLAPEALEAFHLLGLEQCATALARAMAFFGDVYPRERSERAEALDALELKDPENWNPFDAMDHAFYAAVQDHGFERAADDFAASRGVA